MTRPDPTAGGLQGSQPVREPGSSKRPWWLLALLAVIAIIVLLLLLSRCGGDDDDAADGAGDVTTSEPAPDPTEDTATTEPTDTGTPTTSDTEPSTAPAPGDTTDAPLVSGDTALLSLVDPVDPDALGALVGQPAEATSLPVQSVPADEGFWAGPSATERVWVQITGEGESPSNVQQDDLITFSTGEIVANDADFIEERNLTAEDGAQQLEEQGVHVTVPQDGFTLNP